ncbi:MAG: hypothetical protein JEZ11_11095 [Desulfobacterales bacterium]|nr:hypothetical protein [Desulfobacterales bacterium]
MSCSSIREAVRNLLAISGFHSYGWPFKVLKSVLRACHFSLIGTVHAQFFANRGKDLFFSGKFQKVFLLPDKLIVNPNGQFTHFPAGIGLDLNAGFTSHVARHTGGMQSIVNSDPAVTDNHFFRLFHQHLLKLIFKFDSVSIRLMFFGNQGDFESILGIGFAGHVGIHRLNVKTVVGKISRFNALW